MSQKIYNGFPQFFSFTYLSGKFYGNLLTQAEESFTDINIQSQLVGDAITIDQSDVNLLHVVRDGSFLHLDQGFEVIEPNVVRIWPGLLSTEVVEFKKLVGASGVVQNIPTVDPVNNPDGYSQTITEATVYTDMSKVAINAFEAILFEGKTRITPHFDLNDGRIDVYINSQRVSINDGVWSIVDPTTIELNDNYSAVRMKVDIIKQRVG